MKEKAIHLNKEILEYAVLGGAILGGGGGGSAEMGKKYASIAVDYSALQLNSIEDMNDDDILITVSMVGAPGAKNQYLTAKDMVRTIEIFKDNFDGNIAGIITNEQGGKATVNGWLQSSILGMPLVDAPCNGRAHPTGAMGSIGLHKLDDYITVQTYAGGNPSTGSYVEGFVRGTIEHTAKLVRMASIEAGGVVAVARNPITVKYAKEHCAIGGVTHSIEVGRVYKKGLEKSVESGVNALCDYLNGAIVAKGEVSDYSLETTGGFDVGTVTVDGCEMTFWNEYATAEKDGKRIFTFPDLLMTLDAKTGEPLTTAMIEKGRDVYVIGTTKENLKLSSAMFDEDLLKVMQDVVGKEMVSYLK